MIYSVSNSRQNILKTADVIYDNRVKVFQGILYGISKDAN